MPQTLRGIDGSVRYDLQRKQTGIMSDTQHQGTSEIVHWYQGYRVLEFSDAIQVVSEDGTIHGTYELSPNGLSNAMTRCDFLGTPAGEEGK